MSNTSYWINLARVSQEGAVEVTAYQAGNGTLYQSREVADIVSVIVALISNPDVASSGNLIDSICQVLLEFDGML